MLIEEVDYLKQWLVTQLEAISEADPGVLAKYVIALLKKDESFHQDTFVEQLEVFLDKATVPFVRNLFEVIETKEYLPVPPKKKRVFTEVKEDKNERKISIDTKSVEQRVVELSVGSQLVDEEEKMNARKRRFDDDRRKRPGRRDDNYDNRRYQDRTRSDDRYLTRDISRDVRDRVGYPKRRGYSPQQERHNSRSPSPHRRSRSPRKQTGSPPRNGKSRRERCRDFDEQGYCLRGGLCQYDHGTDPVIVEESSLSSVLQAAQTPVLPPPPTATLFPVPIFPPGENYNPDKPAMINNQIPLVPAPPQPLPPPPPVSTISTTTTITPVTEQPPAPHTKTYVHTIKRAPSTTGVPRSFKLVDGSNIVTGAVVPVETNQTTLLIRDIPYQSNNSALLAHHLGKFGPIKQLQCRVYNDVHTALVEYHTHEGASNCFNSNIALIGVKYIKFFWKEVVPISLAAALFKNVGKSTVGSIHQDMNYVNNNAAPTPTPPVSKPTVTVSPTPKETPRPTAIQKKRELLKRTQGLLSQNVQNQKLILSKLESCKISSEKRSLLETLKKLQESHATIKSSLKSQEAMELKKPAPIPKAPPTTLGASTNLDLRPKEIIVKNCNNAEELQQHFSKFGLCTVLPSGVGVIIGFDKRRDAEMAYVKGRIVDDQELDIEWNKTTETQPSQVAVEPIR